MGRGPCAEAVDDGMEAGDTKVGGGPHSYVGAGAITGLVLGATGWDDGYLSRNQGQGGSYRSGKGEVKKVHNNK